MPTVKTASRARSKPPEAYQIAIALFIYSRPRIKFVRGKKGERYESESEASRIGRIVKAAGIGKTDIGRVLEDRWEWKSEKPDSAEIRHYLTLLGRMEAGGMIPDLPEDGIWPIKYLGRSHLDTMLAIDEF